MRYGKVEHNDWLLEFRFNWKESKYDVYASHDEERLHSTVNSDGTRIGLVWKNPRKSRRKPCWEAYLVQNEESGDMLDEFAQMREAGIALLDYYLNQEI